MSKEPAHAIRHLDPYYYKLEEFINTRCGQMGITPPSVVSIEEKTDLIAEVTLRFSLADTNGIIQPGLGDLLNRLCMIERGSFLIVLVTRRKLPTFHGKDDLERLAKQDEIRILIRCAYSYNPHFWDRAALLFKKLSTHLGEDTKYCQEGDDGDLTPAGYALEDIAIWSTYFQVLNNPHVFVGMTETHKELWQQGVLRAGVKQVRSCLNIAFTPPPEFDQLETNLKQRIYDFVKAIGRWKDLAGDTVDMHLGMSIPSRYPGFGEKPRLASNICFKTDENGEPTGFTRLSNDDVPKPANSFFIPSNSIIRISTKKTIL